MWKKRFQGPAVIMSVLIFLVGTGLVVVGAVREVVAGTAGTGLAFLVGGAATMTMAGLLVSIAGKLLHPDE